MYDQSNEQWKSDDSEVFTNLVYILKIQGISKYEIM